MEYIFLIILIGLGIFLWFLMEGNFNSKKERRNAAVGFMWPKTEQSLYSGSATIEYKFVFQQWTTPVMFLHVEIE